MLKGKRGFTLLEILIVMIITAITLPVVGTVFYMLLSVPTKETGRLITINDVNLALNWIHEDVNRGQFFAGDPGMLMSINTIDFTSGVNASQQAWQKLVSAPTSPADRGTEANASQYQWINASDSYRWATSLTGSPSDGQLETQMFKFTINASLINISEIQNIVVSWKGYGENDSQHATQIRIWNYSASQWEHFNVHEAVTYGMGSEGWLSGRETISTTYPITNYVNVGREMYVLAQTSKHVDSGCPFLYGWDGKGYQFIETAIPTAFTKTYEDTSYHRATALEPKDGYYDMMLQMGLPETSYINNLGLWAVDHPQGTEILLECPVPPERSGIIHTIRNPQPVAARDRDGNDVTSLLASQDGEYWESNLSGKDFNDTDNLYDWITITLPEERHSGTAKLILDARFSDLAPFQLWYLWHFTLGTPNVDYITNLLETDQEFISQFNLFMWLSNTFLVQQWNGSEWVDYSPITQTSMQFGNPLVVPINLSDISGNQLRLYTSVGVREIDYVAVDYTEDEPVNITQLEPVAATEHCVNGSTGDVLAEISATDDSYAVIDQGDYINYRFNAMAPPAEGMQRTFIFPVTGYYYINGPEVPEDKMDNWPLFEELVYVPHAYCKWVIPRYINLEADASSKYYNTTIVVPPFPTNINSHTLYTNYIKVTLLTPGMAPTLSQEYMGQTYGGFYWVDRTNASNSISYTVHYYYAEASHQLVRQEWQDNQLTSTTSLAFNIVNFDDITFEYYPAGTKSVTDILPYLWVDIWATAGEGASQVMAHGTSHLAVRGTTLSRGVAVLATEPTGSGNEAILISGTKLVVDGNMRSYGNITVTGDNNLITGEAEAAMYVFDDKGACANPVNSSFLGAVGWDMNVSDFVDDPNSPASNEYIWNGDVVLDTATTDMNGKLIWDNPPTNTVFKPGVYYSKTGNISLGKNNVSGMVTLVGKKVIVTSNYSYMSPFCNGVLLYGYGDSNDSVRFSGNGGAWSGSLFARDGGVTINGTMTQPFYLFGSVAAKRLNYSANSKENFTIKY